MTFACLRLSDLLLLALCRHCRKFSTFCFRNSSTLLIFILYLFLLSRPHMQLRFVSCWLVLERHFLFLILWPINFCCFLHSTDSLFHQNNFLRFLHTEKSSEFLFIFASSLSQKNVFKIISPLNFFTHSGRMNFNFSTTFFLFSFSFKNTLSRTRNVSSPFRSYFMNEQRGKKTSPNACVDFMRSYWERRSILRHRLGLI